MYKRQGKSIFWFVTYAIILFIIIYIVINLILALRKTTNKIQQRRIALILGGISAMGLELVMKWCGLFGSYNPFAFGAFVLVLCMYESMIRYGYFSSVVSAPANVLDIGDEGVFMLDEHGEVIYIGKAKALKNRVTSYFRGEHLPKVEAMVEMLRARPGWPSLVAMG